MIFVRFLTGIVACACALSAQTATRPPAGRSIGEVTSIDAAAKQIRLKSDKGDAVSVTLGEKTLFLRVPPGEKDLTKAARISLADIAVGDRVLARGQVSEDEKSVTAAAVIVMSRAELAKMHERKREEWQTRGATGTVASVDDGGKRFIINVRTREGMKPMTVEPGDKAEFWRYAPDSVKFADARPGAFSDIKPGDQARVLGEKSADGGSMKAEQVVSGTFRQMAGTVLSVNAAAGEVQIRDLVTKKPVAVKVNGDTSMKKLPQMAAMMLARRLNPDFVAAGQGRPSGVRPAGGAPEGAGPRGAGGPGGPGGGDMQQMLERLPNLDLAELKPGDALIVSSTAGADPARVTAISMMAGVEPLLTAAPERAINFGGWSFGEIGMPQ